jgi:DNA-binding MarR family transcriptional regulator
VESDEDIARDILRTIRRMIRRISLHSKQMQREMGVSVPQVLCLKAILELQDTSEGTIGEVSERLQLSPPTVSRIVERLVIAGWVLRDRSEVDHRKVRLRLTPPGLEQVQNLPVPLQETFLRRLAELPTQHREQLRDALRQVADLMNATDLDAAPLLAPGDDVPP